MFLESPEDDDQYSGGALQGHVTSWTYIRFVGDSSRYREGEGGDAAPGKPTLRALALLYVIPISDSLLRGNFDRLCRGAISSNRIGERNAKPVRRALGFEFSLSFKVI